MSPRKKASAGSGRPIHMPTPYFASGPSTNTAPPLFLDFDSKLSALNGPPFQMEVPQNTYQTNTPTSAFRMDASSSFGLPSSSRPDFWNVPPAISASEAPTGLAKSLHDMNMNSYTIRDNIQATLTSDTTTDANYSRYVRDYKFWWANNEASLCNADPTRVPIPALPITAGKVITFLNYELHRPKVSLKTTPFKQKSLMIGPSAREAREAISSLVRMSAVLLSKEPSVRWNARDVGMLIYTLMTLKPAFPFEVMIALKGRKRLSSIGSQSEWPPPKF